jgi:hypothetical protein
MSIRAKHLAVSLIIAAGLSACEEVEQLEIQKVSYAEDVEPILQKHCVECHVPGQQGAVASGLLMDSYASVMKGGQFGPVIDPGSPISSSLYILVSGKADLTISMPHGKEPLGADEVETIRAWIENGAVEN